MKRGTHKKSIAAAFKIWSSIAEQEVSMMFSWTARARVSLFLIECNQLIIGEVCADRLCDRTADKSEPDKADFCRSDV